MTLDPSNIDQFSLAAGKTLTLTIAGDQGDSTVTFTGQTGGSTFTGDDLISALNGDTVTGITTSLDADTTFTKNDDGTLTMASTTTGASSSLKLSIDTSASTASTDITNVSDLGIDVTTATGRDAGESLNVSTQDAANAVLDKLDTAIDTVSKVRAEIGAQESRFEFTSDSIATSVENLESAKSAITDVDVASEEAKLASSQVKVQAAVAAASSANQMTQDLLKLMQ
jgi:flagellin